MIGLAIFGAGRIGHVHAQNILNNPRARLAYVYDPVPRNAESLAALTGARVSSIEAILSASEVEGVLVTSPATNHATQLVAAARAGKAVLCEKPLSLELAEAKVVLESLSALGSRCMMGFHRRYDAQFRAARDAIEHGDVGRVFQMTISSRSAAIPDRAYLSTSGGLFRDQSIHDFDIARFLLGEEFKNVYAIGGCLIDAEVEAAGDIDTAMITMVSASGCQVHINNGRYCPSGYDQRVEIMGTLRSIAIENIRQSASVRSDASGSSLAAPVPSFIERYAAAYRAELATLLDFIEGRNPSIADQSDGYQAQRLAEAAYQSLRAGAPVSLHVAPP